jgi:hypothetical protein
MPRAEAHADELVRAAVTEPAAPERRASKRTCQSQLMAYSAAAGLGRPPIAIRPEEAAVTRGQVGFEVAAWFQFQPIWERISLNNPDIFD